MLNFFVILLATILFSFLPERMIKPRPSRFTLKNIIQQSLIVTFLFLFLTLIVQRAVFTALAISIFLIILVAVSNAKTKALKEPMVFSDFAMFSQAFKHPRLYFPFLGLAPVIIAPIIIIALIITVLKLEPALPFTWQRIISTLAAMLIIFLVIKSVSLKFKLSNQADKDNASFGLINSLVAYALQARTKEHKEQIAITLQSSPFASKPSHNTPQNHKSTHPPFLPFLQENKPNITVIQSESFFDARHLHPAIKQSVLENFDAINAESIQYGKLQVPAWGANTMRTEFSFLTGLANEDLGFYRYYPYQFVAKYPLNSLASTLHDAGYYCVCIHPHPASFFGRDKIFPKIGFDEFIDIEKFQNQQKFGPYIADDVVTEKILEVTRKKTDKPLFIFAITMENHGPLHLEKINKKEASRFYHKNNNMLSDTLEDLHIYLRHLKNADLMIKSLTEAYKKSKNKTLLCFYGDHVPSMPQVFKSLQFKGKSSDYFIWSSTTQGKSNHLGLNIESLATQLFKVKP